MVMPMATGNNVNRKLSKLLARAGAKMSANEKQIGVIAYGNNNSSNDASCTHR
jgi:hypothetical protein